MKTHTQKLYSIVASIIISILVLMPSVSNFKYNDHSKNWLNHDYGKNLLSSTEEYSVFMTEGGDNQVFSSLYFTYAEKLRQDIFPYDQKGNIFKRIYGDLRYVTSDILDERTAIVDKGLFTGLEPFYAEIRSSRKPYLVPYALGKPATYLTWKRPNQHELGNFYYKNYGLMYRVQDIVYAIVDYVEPLNTADIYSIQKYLDEKLGRKVTDEELTSWIDEMVQEGYISQDSHEIKFVKSYAKPFEKDPTDSFIIRWDEIDNLPHYDYLSREIVISYSYEQLNLLGDRVEELQKSLANEQSEANRTNIQQKINQYWAEIHKNIQTIKTVGYDSAATLHNVGIFYLTAKDRFDFITNDLMVEAIPLWEQTVKVAPYAWSSYNILFWAYIRQSFIDPENSEEYLQRFDDVREHFEENLSHWNSMRKNIRKSQPYQQSEQLFSIRDQYSSLSGVNLISERESIENMVAGTVDFDLNVIKSYFGKMVNQLTFIEQTPITEKLFTLWEQLIIKYMSNPEFLEWNVGIVGELSAYKNLVDKKIFIVTLQQASSRIPSVSETTVENLVIFINVFKIAIATGDAKSIKYYKQLLLERAKILLPAEQYIDIKAQINQLG